MATVPPAGHETPQRTLGNSYAKYYPSVRIFASDVERREHLLPGHNVLIQ
jgi:hypothetical protein